MHVCPLQRFVTLALTWPLSDCVFGCLCLAASVRFAHGSLVHKLKSRVTNARVYNRQRSNGEVPAFQMENGMKRGIYLMLIHA